MRLGECGGELFTGKPYAAGGDACGWLRQQAHDCQCGHRLPAAGLADNAEDFAFIELEADILDRADFPAGGLERGGEARAVRAGSLLNSQARIEHVAQPVAQQIEAP